MHKKLFPIGAALVVLGVMIGTPYFATVPAFGKPPDVKPNDFASWDKTFDALDRFELVMNDEAVLDFETGLVWEQSPTITFVPWSTARAQCANKSVGGRKGWRLPSFHELASLVDPSVPLPGLTLPTGHPFTDVQTTAAYFSATSYATNPDVQAWGAQFVGGIVGAVTKTLEGHAWCVRGGSAGPSEH